MARIRVIHPEFWLDDELAKLSPHARLLFIGLWGICDDNYATFPDRPEWIKVQVFPYEDLVNIRRLLVELSKSRVILSFESEGQRYWFIKNFFKYQRVDRPSKPKYPPFPKNSEANSSTTPRTLDESSVRAPAEVKLSKEKLSKEKGREVEEEKENGELKNSPSRTEELRQKAHVIAGRPM